jgi:flagellar biosynthesis regulator FlaF
MMPPKNPYQRMQQATDTQKSFEARIFRSVNYELQKSKENGDSIGLRRAIANDYLLWQTLLYDVSSDENKLPVELRRSLAIVAKSVIKEIDENMITEPDIDFLISINASIIDGLSVTPPT